MSPGVEGPTVFAAKAGPEHKPAIEKLRSQAIAEIRDQRGGALLLATRTADESPEAGAVWFVGLIEQATVGFAQATVEQLGGERVAMIAELYVDPRTRQAGVAEALLAAVRNWAIEHRCTHIESQVLPGNREAKNFFERLGMVTRLMRVSAPLVDEG